MLDASRSPSYVVVTPERFMTIVGYPLTPSIAHTDFSGAAEEGTWRHVSAHAIAASPFGPWQVVDAPPYTRTITWEGGEEMEVYTRE